MHLPTTLCVRMNILLLEPNELHGDGTALVADARRDHMVRVLRIVEGQELRAGMLDGMLGTATVLAIGRDGIRVRCTFDQQPSPVHDHLVLAVPRPKVLLRMLEHAAALGFAHVHLLRSWRVEHGHLHSRALDPAAWRTHLLAGLAQAGRTRLPTVRFFERFRSFTEDAMPHLDLPNARFVAHPRAAVPVASLALAADAPFVLALGPDGGWIDLEVATLAEHGFVPVSCGTHPLRTETALAVLAGQLDLLRRQAARRTLPGGA